MTAGGEPGGPSADGPARAGALLAALLVLGLVLSLGQALVAPLDFDETQYLHSAWLWQQGLTPYRDFFENHPPLYFFLLRGLFLLGDAELLPLFVAGRLAAWLAALGAVLAAWYFCRCLAGRPAAWCGAALVALTAANLPVFVHLRPDVLSLGSCLLAAGLVLQGLGLAREGGGPRPWRCAAGGLAAALAVCLQTKAVFLAGPLACFLALFAAREAWRGERRPLAGAGLFFLAAVLPAGLQAAWFLAAVGREQFWYFNFAVNRELLGSLLRNAEGPRLALGLLFTCGPWLWPLAAPGLGFLGGAESPGARWRLGLLLALLAASLALLFAYVPWPHYQLGVLFLLAAPAGVALAEVTARCSPPGRSLLRGALAVAAGAWLFLIALNDLALPQRLPATVARLQEVLDRSRPGDAFLSANNYNPVLLPDADPRLIGKFLCFPDDAHWRELREAMDRLRPRFLFGFNTRHWGRQGFAPIVPDPALLEHYQPLGGDFLILERR